MEPGSTLPWIFLWPGSPSSAEPVFFPLPPHFGYI
jgi:hypothetical protein